MTANQASEKIIGVVGGMGPESGVELCKCIVKNSSARSDQEHLSMILMSFPGHISDRTAFIQGTTKLNPAYSIANIIRRLQQSGATVAGLACNTAHAESIFNVILAELEKVKCGIKLLNMPEETCKHITRTLPGAKRVGVLMTNGSYRSGIYSRMLSKYGFEPVLPEVDFQDNVIHRIIYDPEFGIKSNATLVDPQVKELLKTALSLYTRLKVDAVVLGCTELSLALKEQEVDGIPILSSTDILARALVREVI
jgi:aspartate racemase